MCPKGARGAARKISAFYTRDRKAPGRPDAPEGARGLLLGPRHVVGLLCLRQLVPPGGLVQGNTPPGAPGRVLRIPRIPRIFRVGRRRVLEGSFGGVPGLAKEGGPGGRQLGGTGKKKSIEAIRGNEAGSQ